MVFSCSNASIESIYFNKQKLSKGLSKKVFFLENPSSPAPMLSHWTPKLHHEGRRVKPWSPPCIGADTTALGSWAHSPLSPHPRTKWVSHDGVSCASQGIGTCLKPPTPYIRSWPILLYISTACAGRRALVVTPRKSKPIPVGYGETTGCLKKALRCILVFLTFRKDTCSRSLKPGEISLFPPAPRQCWAP